MSFIVDIVSDVWDAGVDLVGDIIEGVGDVVESVGDFISDAASWIDDNVIQPILDDPITFIVSAAAYAYGIPGLSFAGPGTAAAAGIATTGSRLAQGDDFDDAIKAGAFSAAGTGITNAIGAGISSGGTDFSPNLYSTADEIAANALKGSASSSAGAKAGVGSIDDQIARSGSVGTSVADDQLLRDLADANAIQRDVFPEYEPLASIGPDELVLKKKDPLLDIDNVDAQKKNAASQADDSAYYKSPSSNKPKAAFTGADVDVDVYKSTATPPDQIYDISKTIKYDVPENTPAVRVDSPASYIDDWSGNVPIEERSTTFMKGVDDIDRPLSTSVKDLAGTVAERAGDWLWDGVKWVWNNPMDALLYGTAGLALIDKITGGDNPPPPTTIIDPDKEAGDDRFNANLPNLELQRDPQRFSTGFDRNKNPYESDLYKYGETQGEHGFYGDTVYKPVEYTQPVTAAQGGSIGALNSQMPSYYRYGAMPMASGGYASGGLRSLKDDGRSDHIPAMLSDGEFVIDAETVALLGNGSNEAGANRLEGMRREVRKQKGAALSKGKFSSNAKSPLSYIKQRRG